MVAREELKTKFATGATPSGEDFASLIDTVGQPGAKGDKGDPGKDGFGTEVQYNKIIERLNKLESPEA